MKHIFIAIRIVMSKSVYRILAVAIAILFFALFVTIPVVNIPGNSYAFQFTLYKPTEILMMIFLALLTGLTLAMQIYTIKKLKNKSKISTAVGGSVSGVSGAFAAVLGTAVCASCLAPFFALLGLSSTSLFFVIGHRAYFLLGAVILMLLSLYFLSRKLTKVCDC